MKKRNIWIIGIIVVVIIIGIVYVNNKSKQEETIKIGAILPFSGSAAIYGEHARNGIEIAKEELKNDNFEIIYEDSLYTPKGGVDAYKKLKDINKIDSVITLASQISLSVQPLSTEDNILQIAIASTSPKFRTPNDLSFRTIPSVELHVKRLVQFMEEKNYSKIGILYANNDFGKGARDSLLEEIKNNSKINIVGDESYLTEAKDFRTSLLKLKEAKPNAVFIIGTATTYVDIFKQSKEIDFKTQYLSIYSAEDPNLLVNAKEESEGLIYAYPSIDSKSITAKKFIEAYKKKYNESPEAYAAEGYEAFRLSVLAFENCKKDYVCTKEYLTNLKDYKSVFGLLSFDNNGDVDYNFTLKTIKNGEFTLYTQ
ncbi:ABC transporter substrate-binding protein [Candidatus Pacearchaeota archaeon]|nr:ABC transporter substrate-binding protein [Candidatus Pacearchaeota archaeon]